MLSEMISIGRWIPTDKRSVYETFVVSWNKDASNVDCRAFLSLLLLICATCWTNSQITRFLCALKLMWSHCNGLTLKRKSLHFDEMFITGCTGSCQNDNFQCSQWWKFRQNDDIFVSVEGDIIMAIVAIVVVLSTDNAWSLTLHWTEIPGKMILAHWLNFMSVPIGNSAVINTCRVGNNIPHHLSSNF